MVDGCGQLEGGEGGSSSYATLVALVPRHHDVAIHTPVWTPAVWENECIDLVIYFSVWGGGGGGRTNIM